jgi:PAS domain S-box-containing protein
MSEKPTYKELEQRVKELEKLESENKRAMETMQESEKLLQNIFDGIREGISILDPDLNIVKVNKWIEETHADHMPLVGGKCYEKYQTRQTPCPWCPTKKSLSTKEVQTEEVKVPLADGSYIWIELSAYPIKNKNEDITGIIEFVKNITMHKQAEEALRASEEKYRGLIEGFNEAVYRMSLPDGRYEYFSPAAKRIFGYSSKEFIDTPSLIQEIIHPEFVDYFQKEWAALLKGNVPQNYEYKVIDPEGNEKWIIQSNKGIFDHQGNIIAIEGICRDVTKRKHAEFELKEYREHLEELIEKRTLALEAKNKELETFTYSVSHDLKAPLRGVDGYSRLLVDEYADKLDEEGLRFLDNIRYSANQMNQLIEDLLSYSRMERRDLSFIKIDIRSLLNELVFEREHEIESRSIQVKLHIPDMELVSDRDSIRQISGNLLDNAIKFTRDEPDAVIEVDGSETAKAWRIWIKDNGIGFDSKYKERIFGIFQRLHRSEDYPGTGVGLALVKKALGRLGGQIWSESGLGKGAVFYFEIPKS